MQLFNDIQGKVTALVAENASTLLTAGGVIGTVATAVLAARSGIKAAQILEADLQMRLDDMPEDEETGKPILHKRDRIEVLRLVGPQFIPPVLTGAATIAAIILANRMNAQKVAALAAAYGVTQKHFDEYKAKVSEKLTGPKKNEVEEELAQERVRRTPGSETIIVGDGEVLCFDEPTGRYFKSTMENIKQAVNSTNAEIIHHDHASASYFYEEIGLPPTSWTDMVGWNTDQLLELTFSTVLDLQNRPCISIDFKSLPQMEYIPKHY